MSRLVVAVGFVVLTFLFAATPAATADLVQKVVLSDSYGTTLGGEFLATPIDFTFTPVSLESGPAGTFETFCVETTETFNWGVPYFVDITTAAVHGGAAGGDPDPLDPRTAYLYEQFITGQLDNYTYGVGDGGTLRAASADALQHVMWYIEDEEPMSWTPGDASLRDLFFQDATQNASDSIGNVRVLNLFGDAQGTDYHQDQLVLIPEPASVLLIVVLGTLLACRTRR